MANAKIGTFTATFSAPLDTATVWELNGAVSATGGRLAIVSDPDFNSILGKTQYDLTNSSVYFQLIPSSKDIASFGLSSATNRYAPSDYLGWQFYGGELQARVVTGNVESLDHLGQYDPVAHGTFVRIRHVSGTSVAFETSIDAVTWTQRALKTVTWDMTAVYVGMSAGGGGGTSYFDNINTLPPAPTVSMIWSSGSSTATLSVGWTTTDVTYARGVLSTSSALTSPAYSSYLVPSIDGNITCQFTGLQEGASYYLGLEVNGALNANGRGNYRTLALALANSKVAAGSTNPTGSTSAVFTRVKTEAPDFFTHMGNVHAASTNVEATWRAALKSTLESSTFRPMLQTVTMTYDWNDLDSGGVGSGALDGWAKFAPNAVRELTGTADYPDSRGLYRTWRHAGVRYIELDRWTFRDRDEVTDSPSKTMLGYAQRDWLIDLLTNAPEPVIVLFAGFPHYGDAVTVAGRWSSYPHERAIIGNAIAALPVKQRNKIVTVSGDSKGIHADDGTNAMWGLPNLCASPLQGSGGVAAGTWSIGNIDADDTRGYFSRLTFTYTAATYTLGMTWDAVRDDGVSVMTWSKNFSTAADRDGWAKDPANPTGKRPFRRKRNPSTTPDFLDGETVSTTEFTAIYNGGTPTQVGTYEMTFDGGGVSG